MKVSTIPLIDMKGKIPQTYCSECMAPARIEYAVGKQVFKLCLRCLIEMERQTSEALKGLLNERTH